MFALKNKNLLFVHMACELRHPTLELVQLLVDQWPEALSIESNGKLPLHSLFSSFSWSSKETPVNLVRFLLEAFPGAAASFSSPSRFSTLGTGYLPFHLACKGGESLEVIKLLLEAYPRAVSTPSTGIGNYPLHELCTRDCLELDVLRYVVEQYPEATQRYNTYGSLPLIYATRARLEIVQYLVDQNPDSAQDSDCFHTAARNGNLEVMKYFYGLNPEAATHVDFGGSTALHKA